MRVITFTNHSPIRITSEDNVETVYDAHWDFGHHLLKRYITKRGKALYWASENSGRCYGTHNPETRRTYLPNAAAIRAYFVERDQLEAYHAEIEADVDAASIIDVDADPITENA